MTAPDSSGSVVNPIQTHKRGAGMEIVLGIVIGVAYVATPGPVNIETMRRGVIGGFRVALAIQLGALLGDLAYALLAVVGVGRVLTHPATQVLLGGAGTGLLIALGWSALSEWRGIAVVAAATTVGVPIRAPQACDDPWRCAWSGLALALANPCGPAFWIAVDNAAAPHAGRHGVAWLSGFGTGALLASLAIALLVGCGRPYLTAPRMRVAASICGLALIASGLGLGCATVLGWRH